MHRHPDYCCHSLIEHLHAYLAKLPAESETIILGDFNADFSAIKNVHAYKLKQKLQRFANLNDFKQLIKSPTRICNQSRCIINLDLVFVINNNHRVVGSGVILSAVSDHCTGCPKKPKNY